ncbi:MAG: heavy-metal-associated domain-containing protein [bacterium]
MGNVTILVKGMSCEGCQAAVEKAIGNLEGVVSAQVDLQGGSAMVDFDVAVVGVGQFKKAVEEAGFDMG